MKNITKYAVLGILMVFNAFIYKNAHASDADKAIYAQRQSNLNFYLAVKSGNLNKVQQAFNYNPTPNINWKPQEGDKSSLWTSVYLGNKDIVEFLLKHGADYSQKYDWLTPLELAKKDAKEGHENAQKIVELLIEYGAKE